MTNALSAGTRMTEGTIEKQLLDLEKQYWTAIKDRNVQSAMRLTDDPCIIVGASGVARISQDTFGKMLQAGGWPPHDFPLPDVQIRLGPADAAAMPPQGKKAL